MVQYWVLLSLLSTLMQLIYSLTSLILFLACHILTNVVAYFQRSIWLLLLFLSCPSHVCSSSFLVSLVLQRSFLFFLWSNLSNEIAIWESNNLQQHVVGQPPPSRKFTVYCIFCLFPPCLQKLITLAIK